MSDFTHFDQDGRALMVDVSAKDESERSATAEGRVVMAPETLALIASGGVKKGDVLSVARLAGIMGAKKDARSHPALAIPCRSAPSAWTWRWSPSTTPSASPPPAN